MKANMKIENPFNYFLLLLLVVMLSIVLKSCNKDDDENNGPDKKKEMTINMSTRQEIPPVKNRTDSASATFNLYSDSTLEYTLAVSKLETGDELTIAHIHAGGPVDAGAPVITLVDNTSAKFSNLRYSGKVKLNSSQYKSIIENNDDYYVNIHSKDYPLGLLRGQFGGNIRNAMNVELVPVNLRPETGLAILRLRGDTLFYKITISNSSSQDSIKSASLNIGGSGVTNGPKQFVFQNENGFGKENFRKLSSDDVNFLLNSEVYISVQNLNDQEIVRGQIR